MYLFDLEFSSFSDISSRVGLVDHMVTLFLVFKGTSILFCIVAAPIYIPINSVGGSPSLHTLSSICLWIFFFFMAESYSIVYVYQIFIHSSVIGHLGCCHVLAMVNSAAKPQGCMNLFALSFCLGISPGVGLLDHMATLLSVFKETSILFSIVAAPVYIPTSSVGGLPFLHPLPRIYYL